MRRFDDTHVQQRFIGPTLLGVCQAARLPPLSRKRTEDYSLEPLSRDVLKSRSVTLCWSDVRNKA